MQGVCTTILHAAHFLRDTDFCCRKERAPEAPGNSIQDAAPGQAENSSHLPQHSLPTVCTGKPQHWHQDTAPFLSPSSGSPPRGRLGESLVSAFPGKGSSLSGPQEPAYRLLDLAPPPGGSVLHRAHSPASWLHSTALQHSRSPQTRWSQTRCAPHTSPTPRPQDEHA